MAEDQQPRIDLKHAVRIAVTTVQELYKDQGYELNDVLLEEVSLQRQRGVWLVTVGFTRPASPTSTIGSVLAGPQRAYKQVELDAESGDFLRMEIRELQAPSQTQK